MDGPGLRRLEFAHFRQLLHNVGKRDALEFHAAVPAGISGHWRRVERRMVARGLYAAGCMRAVLSSSPYAGCGYTRYAKLPGSRDSGDLAGVELICGRFRSISPRAEVEQVPRLTQQQVSSSIGISKNGRGPQGSNDVRAFSGPLSD